MGLKRFERLGQGYRGGWKAGKVSVTAVGMVALLACPLLAQNATATPPAGSSGTDDEAQHAPLTKQQAKDLFRSVDEIMAFASKDSQLPIQHSVKRKLITREQVNKYLREKFNDDKDTKRMERSELVLKKFGLLDRDFQLRPFLISLLTEQVAGFYDDKTKTVNLLDWIDPDEQKPVLAHELTHALQDQKVDLAKWSSVGSDDVAKNVQEDNQHIQTDEADTARDAVAEGQAMVVFLDYSMRDTGRTLADAPGLLDKLKNSITDTSGSPILARAPLLLQKSLMFPYSEGLGFEDAVLLKKGRDGAFAQVLATPPSSTSEILHPDDYMAHAPVPLLRMPDIHPLLDADYEPYDVGVMGEFDVRILTELFGGPQIAAALAPEWNGGIYYAAQRKSATAEEKNSTASLGMFYESKWKDEDSARSFLRVYQEELPRKYSGLKRRTHDEADDGEQVYSTNEGDVLLSIDGNGVFISEGFPLALARKLRDEVMSAQSSGPLQVAGLRHGDAVHGEDPGISVTDWMESAGIMKAGFVDMELAR